MTSADSLDDFERTQLARAERTIRRGLRTFVAVGEALLTIRDRRLYRATHPSFEAYCADRWRLSHRHANRLIQAAEVVRVLGPGSPVPAAESQARELAPLLPEPSRLRRVWGAVVAATGGRPTAAAVRAAVREPAPAADPPATIAPPMAPPELTVSEPKPESPTAGPESGGPVIIPPAAPTTDAPPAAGDASPRPSSSSPGRGEAPGPLAGFRARRHREPLLTPGEVADALINPAHPLHPDERACRMALMQAAAGRPVDLALVGALMGGAR